MLGTASIKLRTVATDAPFVNWLRSVTFFSRLRVVIPKISRWARSFWMG